MIAAIYQISQSQIIGQHFEQCQLGVWIFSDATAN